jgi:hypothetical protein
VEIGANIARVKSCEAEVESMTHEVARKNEAIRALEMRTKRVMDNLDRERATALIQREYRRRVGYMCTRVEITVEKVVEKVVYVHNSDASVGGGDSDDDSEVDFGSDGEDKFGAYERFIDDDRANLSAAIHRLSVSMVPRSRPAATCDIADTAAATIATASATSSVTSAESSPAQKDNLQQHQERYNTNVLHGRRGRGQPLQGDVSSVADGSSPSSAASTGMATSKSNKIKAKKGETRSASNSDMLAELVHNDTPSTSSPTGGGGRASNRHGRRRRSSTSRRRPSLIQRQTDAALSSASNRHRRRRSSTSCRPSLLIQQKNAASGAGAESDGDDSGGSGFSDDEELRSETNAKMKAKAKVKAKRQWESSKKLIPLVNMGHNYRARFRGNAAHDGALQIQRCVRGSSATSFRTSCCGLPTRSGCGRSTALRGPTTRTR